MRTLAVLAVLAFAVIFGVHELEEATEYHGGSGSAAQTTVVFTVRLKHYPHSIDDAARALWNTCAGTIGWSSDAEPVRQSDGSYLASVRPSLADDADRRLNGCLNEATLDRVQGHVRSTVN